MGWLTNAGAILSGLSGIAILYKKDRSSERLFIMSLLCFISYTLANQLYIASICQTVQVIFVYARYGKTYDSWW